MTENGPLVGAITVNLEFSVPKDCEKTQNPELVKIPVEIVYTLKADDDFVGVKVKVDNKAKDHWLRVNFPTEINTDVSIADSHFDIVKRSVEIPDSTGWVEQAFGTHPLRTFATVTDGEDGLAVMPKGLFEYEVFDDSTIALTLIRACRIKLAVSEEKMTELDDEGVQCPGVRSFEYALNFYNGDYESLPNKAADIFAPVKCAVSGRGKGTLPKSQSVLSVDNTKLHVTAVKNAEDNSGIIVRMYNPTEKEQTFSFGFGRKAEKVSLCKMNEEVVGAADIKNTIKAKKIATYKIEF